MIQYQVVVTQTRNNTKAVGLKGVSPKDPDFRQVVFQRQLNANHFRLEDRIKVRGTNKRGMVIGVETDINNVNWSKNRPHFLRVRFDGGEILMCYPGQLKRSNK